MSKLAILVSGTNQTGKTDIIKTVAAFLCAYGINTNSDKVSDFAPNKGNDDITMLLKYWKDKKTAGGLLTIGIESDSDFQDRANKNHDCLVKSDCDIVILAVRSSQGHQKEKSWHDKVREKFHEYDIKEIKCHKNPDDADATRIKEAKAILEYIKKF